MYCIVIAVPFLMRKQILSTTNKIQIYVCIQMWLMPLLYLGLEGNCKARAHFSPGFKNIRYFVVIKY